MLDFFLIIFIIVYIFTDWHTKVDNLKHKEKR